MAKGNTFSCLSAYKKSGSPELMLSLNGVWPDSPYHRNAFVSAGLALTINLLLVSVAMLQDIATSL